MYGIDALLAISDPGLSTGLYFILAFLVAGNFKVGTSCHDIQRRQNATQRQEKNT